MTKLPITIEDNEVYLRQISDNVDILNDKDLNEDIKVLDEFCLTNEVMAMAAIQLGIKKRIVYLKNTNLDLVNKLQKNELNEDEKNYNEAKVLINPVIIKREGLTEYWEACASCLDNCGLVYRPYKIEIEYYDISGNKQKEICEGFKATVLSHEMDHLDGILHIDIAQDILKLTTEERKKWRQEHGYIIYNETGDYNSLLKEKLQSKTL